MLPLILVLTVTTRNIIKKISLFNASFFTAKLNASYNLNYILYYFLKPCSVLGKAAIHQANTDM